MLTTTVAIVTGAGSGISKAAAIRLAADGAAVALFDIDETGLTQTKREIEKAGGTALDIAVDISRHAHVVTAVEQTVAQLGKPTVLLNGAGIIIRKDLLHTSPEEWDQVLRVNVGGSYNLLQAVVPVMAAAGGGSIIQIASSAAHLGGHGYPSYTASKGAILALTRQLAGELAPMNIRINSISPGAVRTAINRDSFANSEISDAMTSIIPLGRIGEPDDLAGVIAFLAGPDSRYVTGIDMPVDGGLISKISLGANNPYNTFEQTKST